MMVVHLGKCLPGSIVRLTEDGPDFYVNPTSHLTWDQPNQWGRIRIRATREPFAIVNVMPLRRVWLSVDNVEAFSSTGILLRRIAQRGVLTAARRQAQNGLMPMSFFVASRARCASDARRRFREELVALGWSREDTVNLLKGSTKNDRKR